MLVVEQSGNGGGAKEAKTGDSGKEVATEVAVADKQDSTNKQYCKIHHTKGHDLQNCKKVEQLVEQQKAEYERRDKEKAQEGTGGSGKKRPGRGGRRGKETDLPAAATRMKMTTMTKTWMMTRPTSRNFRKPQRSCALTVVLLCILRTANSSGGCGK